MRTEPAESGLRQTTAAALVVVGYVLATHRDAVFTFFFLDDWWLLRDGARACGGKGWALVEIFRPGPAGFLLFRPLSSVGYACALHALFGYDASAYHATQLVVFAINAVLVLLIARRLTDSTLAGLAAGLLYAAAPGQAVGVYWLSAFSVTGTALAMLLLCWCWLTLRSWHRVVACTALQAVALLGSEHAIVGPVLLLVLSAVAPERESARHTLAALLGPAAVATAYAASKLIYSVLWRIPAPYALTADPVLLLRHLGAYFAACFDFLALLELSDAACEALGAGFVAVGVIALWRAARVGGAWRLVAGGAAFFTVALLPVLPLEKLYRDFYIGLAAAGAVLMIVGACFIIIERAGPWLALSIALASVGLGISTQHRASRENETFELMSLSSDMAARWLAAVQTAEHPGLREVWLPYDRLTESVFIVGQAETYFPGVPPRVVLYDGPNQPTPGPNQAVLVDPPPALAPGQQLPGWLPRWSWIRTLGGNAPASPA